MEKKRFSLCSLLPVVLAGALVYSGTIRDLVSRINDYSKGEEIRQIQKPLTPESAKELGLHVVIPRRINTDFNNQPESPQSELERIAEKEKSIGEKEKIPNPYTIEKDFALDTEQMILARTIFGEARRELNYPDYVAGVAASVLNRAKISGKSIKEIVLDKNQYSCFNLGDNSYETLKNPINCGELPKDKMRKIWEKCYDTAEQAIDKKLKIPKELEKATNYYVGKPAKAQTYSSKREIRKAGIPSWAFKMSDKGIYMRDEKGFFIPEKPVQIINVGGKRNSYFYDFKNF